MSASRGVLHIGSAGGTRIRRMLSTLQARLESDDAGALPEFLDHDQSRRPWLAASRDEQTFALVFRDPDRRYASGFMSRLRQGRPELKLGQRLWSPAEATAFSWFRTPDALFEALGSDDETELSAAHFAMSAIFHLKRDHHWYLGSAEEFLAVRDRFWFVRPLTELTEHLHELLPDSSPAVHERAREVFERRHAADTPTPPLSARSREMLRVARPDEYALYDTLVAEHARRTAL